MDDGRTRPYALKAGEGWTYNYGIDVTVKAGELGKGRRLAFVEYTTRAGEEPPDHTHATEDEIFYVLKGAGQNGHPAVLVAWPVAASAARPASPAVA